MRVLVTGATGFVAPYVARELANANFDVVLTAPDQAEIQLANNKNVKAEVCDFTDLSATRFLLQRIQPDVIVHQGALSHVGQAWDNRMQLVKVNINGISHLCQAAVELNKPISFLYGSSAMVYGSATTPLSESDLPHPVTPFGASKLAGEYVLECFRSSTFNPYIVRPFNIVGPRQSRAFVCPAFAHRLAMTTNGGQVEVGNLDSQRDFTDVRDLARAYRLILEKQPKDHHKFVLGSGRAVMIRHLLGMLMEIMGKQAEPVVNRDLLRPSDPHLIANPALAAKVLGWRAEIALETSLKELANEALRG
jgi:GDP-4-dehydro-6-deoxy-D-mannose reductase